MPGEGAREAVRHGGRAGGGLPSSLTTGQSDPSVAGGSARPPGPVGPTESGAGGFAGRRGRDGPPHPRGGPRRRAGGGRGRARGGRSMATGRGGRALGTPPGEERRGPPRRPSRSSRATRLGGPSGGPPAAPRLRVGAPASQLDDSRAVLLGAKPPEDLLWPRPVISPTRDRIATIECEGAAIRLWDATTGAAVGLVRGHEGPVLVLCSSPDGSVRLRPRTGPFGSGTRKRETVAVLRGHERPVEKTTYGPAGRSSVVNPGAARTPAVGDDRADRERSRSPGVSPPGAVQRPLSVNRRGRRATEGIAPASRRRADSSAARSPSRPGPSWPARYVSECSGARPPPGRLRAPTVPPT